VVRFFARIFYRLLALSGAESLSAAVNIFVGIESSLTIRPYLMKMTRSELLTLMTCMMATVASTVMGIYVIALQDIFPEIAGHLVSASLISIPCAVIASKLSLPEQEIPETLKKLPQIENDTHRPENFMVALVEGGIQGVKMAVGIATVLIVILGLEALVDLALAEAFGKNFSLKNLLGWVTLPFSALLGLQHEEWHLAGKILGSRFVETEVSAYFALAAAQVADPAPFTQRSAIILTYALCGFVHFASMGIFIGGLAALAPSRAHDITVIGGRSLWTAFLATVLTGCITGALVIV
jgi:CNT family concentrative nucleoside transporter